jgi:hypothetical protein
MASIKLNITGYGDADTVVNSTEAETNLANYLHELTHELDVTFDDSNCADLPVSSDETSSILLEFTGPYIDLITLIERYENDLAAQCTLIMKITNIHG